MGRSKAKNKSTLSQSINQDVEKSENVLLKFKEIYNTASTGDKAKISKESSRSSECVSAENTTSSLLINSNYEKVILDKLSENLEKAKQSYSVAEQMFETVKKTPKLKVVEAAVPKGILPPGYAVALYDVRIAGHGPDEKIYRSHKWIRDNVTRGLTFMRITGNEKLFDFAIYANKKFTGGVGDEDESQPENNDVWREFCLEPPEKASQVICMTKLNGEAGHFAVRNIGGEFYVVAGSKNVHLLCKTHEDIEKYTDSRYQVARTVATATLNALQAMEEEKRACLLDLLNATKMTVVCEVLQPDYQHIVNLSHLKESTIHMLMLASVASQGLDDSFTAIPPHLALGVGLVFGLSVADYFSLTVDELQDRIPKMRGTRDSEGFVLYYLQGDRTIGLAKVKTVWYVMLRALREKADYTFNAKKQKESSLQDRIKATHKRFAEIQKWLKFSDEYRKNWEKLGGAFIMYLDENIKKGKLYSKSLRPKFPCIWATFLADTNRTDLFKLENT